MSRFLMVDIGAGTMDVLVYDDLSQEHFKAVVKSPVRTIAEKATGLEGNLLVTGREMGGGPISSVLAERAKHAEVLMTASAAATIHHNPDRVRALGIRIIPESETETLARSDRYARLDLADVEVERLKELVEGFGVPFVFDAVGICAQDHGVPPEGQSHLNYRHTLFQGALDANPFPHALLYRDHEVPHTLNRLKSIAEGAKLLPAAEIYVMDSGMAAMSGACLDIRAKRRQNRLVLDIATSHTLGAALIRDEIAGFFEYHTRDITLARLEELLQDLADGKLEHDKILREGGHGAYIRKAFGFQAVEIIVATGPLRKLVEKTTLPMEYGAPLGDNMMTGTAGLLEAIRRRKGLAPLPVL
jgi:uncharacterized protein (DUF1786 family)